MKRRRGCLPTHTPAVRVGLSLIGVAFILLGILTLVRAVLAIVDVAPSIIAAQEAQVREGLMPASEVWSRSKADSPYIGPVGLNSPAVTAVRGGPYLIVGAGVLFFRRWAMLLGLPLLLVLVVESDAVPRLLDQVRQGNQPGSFAAIGIPMFGLMIALPAVAFIVLLRAALARPPSARPS